MYAGAGDRASCRITRPPFSYSKLEFERSVPLSLPEVEYEYGALAVGRAHLVAAAVPAHLEDATCGLWTNNQQSNWSRIFEIPDTVGKSRQTRGVYSKRNSGKSGQVDASLKV